MNTQEPLDNPLKVESAPSPTEPLNALAALRSIRQARGLSIEDVSARLKFAPRLIEAFENERWDELPSGIGLRALAKNYCRFLGVEMSAIEPLLPGSVAHAKSSMAEHTSTRSLGTAVEHVSEHRSWPWITVILLVVFVVLGVAVWQGIVPQEVIPGWLKGMLQ